MNCPSCNHELPQGAVLCLNCHYHLELQKHIKLESPEADKWVKKRRFIWLLCTFIIWGMLALVALAESKVKVTFDFMGWNPMGIPTKWAFFAVLSLAFLPLIYVLKHLTKIMVTYIEENEAYSVAPYAVMLFVLTSFGSHSHLRKSHAILGVGALYTIFIFVYLGTHLVRMPVN